jgi:two-component system sensor histidine kinase TctE
VLHRETLRLSALVNQLLESREHVSVAFIDGACDLGEQLANVCELLRPQARSRGVTIEYEHRAGLRVHITPIACAQIFINILENAVSHGRAGGLIRIGHQHMHDIVCVTVDDDGPGIDRAERRAVFGWGARGAGSKRPGCGIGLAIVKTIVDGAGGSAIVGESPLGGARIEVRLPVQAESLAAAS